MFFFVCFVFIFIFNGIECSCGVGGEFGEVIKVYEEFRLRCVEFLLDDYEFFFWGWESWCGGRRWLIC